MGPQVQYPACGLFLISEGDLNKLSAILCNKEHVKASLSIDG